MAVIEIISSEGSFDSQVRRKINANFDALNKALPGKKPPTAPNAAGKAGQVAFDDSYLYVCVDDNTWKRVALEAWTASKKRRSDDDA